jgi:hypothetical protein
MDHTALLLFCTGSLNHQQRMKFIEFESSVRLFGSLAFDVLLKLFVRIHSNNGIARFGKP